MNRTKILLFFILFTITGCGEAPTPEEQLGMIEDAMEREEYESAYILCQTLMNSEHELGADMRFQTEWNSIECEISLGKYEEAVENIRLVCSKRDEKKYREEPVGCILQATSLLLHHGAPVKHIVEVIKIGKDRCPGKKTEFENLLIDTSGYSKRQQIALEEMSTIADALKAYVEDFSLPPTELEVLLRPSALNEATPYLDDAEILLDPWGNSYEYHTKRESCLDLLSCKIVTLGADGTAGGWGENRDLFESSFIFAKDFIDIDG